MVQDDLITEAEQKTNLVVGVVGFSDESKFNAEEAKDALNNIFNDLEDEHITTGHFEEIEIVSGLTDQGIPKIAYEVAEDRDYKTVGLTAGEATEKKTRLVDEVIIIGDKFGDESKTLIDYVDILVKIGGGDQAQKEIELAEGDDIEIIEYDFE